MKLELGLERRGAAINPTECKRDFNGNEAGGLRLLILVDCRPRRLGTAPNRLSADPLGQGMGLLRPFSLVEASWPPFLSRVTSHTSSHHDATPLGIFVTALYNTLTSGCLLSEDTPWSLSLSLDDFNRYCDPDDG